MTRYVWSMQVVIKLEEFLGVDNFFPSIYLRVLGLILF